MSTASKVAVVTGASRGLGREVVNALLLAGYVVHGVSRETTPVGISDAAAKRGVAVHWWKADVRDYSKIREIMGAIGPVDVLVNNAGIVHPRKPVQEVRHEDFDPAFETHFCGPLGFIEAVLPGMLERDSGVIVNVASKAARYAVPMFAAYNASKAALVSLTQTLAKEVRGTGIRVLSLSPGGIRTGMRVKAYGEADAAKQQAPEFVASVILDLVLGTRMVPNGADILVWKGAVEVFPMEDRF